MKSSKTSFLRNCISGWNVRSPLGGLYFLETYYLCVAVHFLCGATTKSIRLLCNEIYYSSTACSLH